MNNNVERAHNRLAVYTNSNKKVFVAKSPNWSTWYSIKFFHIDGFVAKINDNKVFTLDSLNITVYDNKNPTRTIPPVWQQELNRDVTQWLKGQLFQVEGLPTIIIK